MSAAIRLSSLSVFPKPPKDGLMAALTEIEVRGYFDDSQTTGELWGIGGYVGAHHHWELFEELWAKALEKHDVPYFHMREMAESSGPFAKWLPPEEHEDERAAYFGDLAKAIGDSGLMAINSLVRVRDLKRFNAEKGLNIEPYPLAAYGCMMLVGQDYIGHATELVFDHVEKVQSKLAKARDLADSDKYHGPDGIYDHLVTTALPPKITSREVPALQAADFWAWECRKNQLNLEEWHNSEGRPEEWGEEQWMHMNNWVQEKYGGFETFTRQSLQELLRPSQFKPIIWSYGYLVLAHEARGGVWA